MGFFKRKRHGDTAGYPRNLAAMAERAGRQALDLGRSRDPTIWGEVYAPLHPRASADPVEFCDAVARECLPVGGLTVYGAERLLLELIGQPTSRPDTPAAEQIIDAATQFLRQSFVPPMRVPGYLWSRFVDGGGTNTTWIPLRQPPKRELASITPLRGDEVRRLLRMDPNPDSNWVLALADGSEFVALVDRRYSDEDPTRSQDEWKRAATLYDLYVDVAWDCQVWDWADPELVPFFPAPKALV